MKSLAKNILVIGATSDIAEAVLKEYAVNGNNIYIVGRNTDRLKSLSKDLMVRGANKVSSDFFEANDFEAHNIMINKAFGVFGVFDVALIAHGTLPNQKTCEKDFFATLDEINTNAISVISLLSALVDNFLIQNMGTIAVITSVAGERGRQSNYIYGSAKGMVSIYLQGLRNRLCKSGVKIVDIRPGLISTNMTLNMDKGLLWTEPKNIAKKIINGIKHGDSIVYAPNYWKYIMFIVRNIPESIFKKLKL